MRHLDRELKWMQNFVAEKKIKLMHMPTQNQTADMLTKASTPAIFPHLRTDISSDSYTQTRRSLFRRRTSSIASQSLSRRSLFRLEGTALLTRGGVSVLF
jgi:hypothetical protein